MSGTPKKISREEFYERIWTTGIVKLGKELGYSYVEMVQLCKKLNVPRPDGGYWYRKQCGGVEERTALPAPEPGSPLEIESGLRLENKIKSAGQLNTAPEQPNPTIEVQNTSIIPPESSVAAEAFPHKNVRDENGGNADVYALAVGLQLPLEETELHPVAQRHLRALEKKKPGEDGFVKISARDLFRCEVTAEMIKRLARALHTIFVELRPRGYEFKSGSDEFSPLRIVNGTDELTIICVENREQIEREPTQEEKRKPSWTWQLKETHATGRLCFEVSAPGIRGRRTWAEGEGKALPEVLGIVVEKIDAAFRSFEDQRRLEIERAKRREEETRRAHEEWEHKQREEAEQERKRRHEPKLAEIAEACRDNLCVAAQAWMESGLVYAYVDECERRWREKGELLPEQSAWIAWAREEAAKLNPRDYPDPKVGLIQGPFL